MKVLVVEDEPGISRFLKQGLSEMGYTVDIAKDGDEGLGFASVYEYDLMVLDVMLPGMNGLTLLRKLRDRGNATPVLMLTARDGLDDRV